MKYHLVGIGGIGMSGIARVLKQLGHQVSGSDQRDSPQLQQLNSEGIICSVGHINNIESDCMVLSAAIKSDNIELKKAQASAIPIKSRGEVVAELFAQKGNRIGVTGTHGKTTTTAMLTQIFLESGRDPSILLGGNLPILEGNARWGKDDVFIAEIDESDATCTRVKPSTSILTSVDAEHLETYKSSMHALEDAYAGFLSETDSNGSLILCKDAIPKNMISKSYDVKDILTYALKQPASMTAQYLGWKDGKNHCDLSYLGKPLGTIALGIPGAYNIYNAMAAALACLQQDLSWGEIKQGLEAFHGLKRRFEIKANYPIAIVDDYAHHPTEVENVIKAAKEYLGSEGKLWVVLQPHRYTRLRDLWQEFASCTAQADHCLLVDVFAASEDPIDGINSECLVEMIKADHPQQHVDYVGSLDQAQQALQNLAKPGDMILCLGAGSITCLSDNLADQLA